jgi:hypothetical protein
VIPAHEGEHAGSRALACRRARGQGDRGGQTSARRHSLSRDAKDAHVPRNQAHRLVGMGGDQISLHQCAKGAGGEL